MTAHWIRMLAGLTPAAALLSKLTALLALGWLAQAMLRRRNPRWRAALWRGVALGLLLTPALAALLPAFEVAVPPVAAVRVESPAPAMTPQAPAPVVDEPPPTAMAPAAVRAAAQDAPKARWGEWLAAARRQAGPILWVVWGAVAAVLGLRLARAARRLRAIVRGSAEAPPHVLAILEDAAARLGCRRAVALRVSGAFPSPFLCGVRRPAILLPPAMAAPEFAGELPAILAHELTHLRSRDVVWTLLFQGLEALLWFHPLAWRMRAAHAAACEEVCDAVAADTVGDALSYSGTLARVALELRAQSIAALSGIPMARVADVRRRIEFLKRKIYSMPIARKWLTLAILAGLPIVTGIAGFKIVLAAPPSPQKNAQQTPTTQPLPARTLHFPKDMIHLAPGILSPLGSVSICDERQNWKEIVQWQKLGLAQGDVNIPAGKAAMLIVNSSVATELNALKTFGPDDLQAVQFTSQNRGSMSALPQLARLTGLRVLYLGHSGVTDDGLSHLSRLTNLVYLDLQNCPISDAGLTHLEGLGALKELWLFRTRVTQKGIEGMRQKLPGCNIRWESGDNYLNSKIVLADAPSAQKAVPNPAEKSSFVVTGQVTDGSGEPMPDVTVRAATGWGTLRGGGQTTTGPDGHYTLHFGPGMWMKNAPGGVGYQAAEFFAEKPGYFERNLCRQGDWRMAGSPEAIAQYRGQDKKNQVVVLPNQPRELNFVMLPAARVSGRIVDSKGRPAANQSIWITGKDQRPASSVYASAMTDKGGHFSFADIPTIQPMWFELRTQTGLVTKKWIELKSSPIDFAQPEDYEMELVFDSGAQSLKARVISQKHLKAKINTSISSATLQFRWEAKDTERNQAEQLPWFDERTRANKTPRLWVLKDVLLSDKDVASIDVQASPDGKAYPVTLQFNDNATKRFAQITAQGSGRRLAIVVQGKVVSAMRVLEAINEGKVTLSSFTKQMAEDLAAAIKATHPTAASVPPAPLSAQAANILPPAADPNDPSASLQERMARQRALIMSHIQSRANSLPPNRIGQGTPIRPNESTTPTSETTLRGTVLTPDGKLAEGAEVALCEPGGRGFSSFVFVGNKNAKYQMAERYKSTAQVITTQADGKYEFKTRARHYGLVARQAGGVAIENEETLPGDGKVRLHPWGRVEGVLKEGNKIIPNHEVQISFDVPRKAPMTSGTINDLPIISFSYTATTDGQGRFIFERIHSGPARIGARVDLEDGKWTFSPMFPIEIKPQGTTVFNLGGMGRAVTGKVALKAGSVPAYSLEDCEIRLQPFMPPMPEAVRKAGREVYEKWRAEWEQTREGKAYTAMKGYNRRMHPDKDGHFSISDVPAGKYLLQVTAYEMRELNGSLRSNGNPIRIPGGALGSMRRDFEVPPMPGGRSDRPLDLGTLEVTLAKIPKSGEQAPDFKCVTLAGSELSIKDYRGKFVLLDFWATWCGPCREETPTLKAVWQQFGTRPNFAMIGLSLDDDREAPAKYVKENGMAWVQGYLGKWADDKVTKSYGVQGIPAIILIGPDGRLIERNLRGAQIGAAVGRALAASAPPPASVKTTSATQAVQVRVVNEAGQPVAGAVVTPDGLRMKADMGSHMGWVPGRFGRPIPATTDAQGSAWVIYPRYATENKEIGAITFNITHPEYCPTHSYHFPVDGSGEAIVMAKGATLTVSGHLSNGDKIMQDLYPVATGSDGWLEPEDWQRRPDGSFVIRQLEPGRHYVRLAWLPEPGRGAACFSAAMLFRAEKGQAYTYDLEIKAGVRLEGRLDASVPRPIKNGSVLVNAYPADMDDETRYGDPNSPGDLEWKVRQPVAPDGHFVFESLPPGKFEIIASCEGYISKSPAGEEWKGSFAYPQRFKLDKSVNQVDLAMEPAATAEVTVLDDQGRPLPGARVSFSPNVQWLRRGAEIFMTSMNTEDLLRRPEEVKRQWQWQTHPFVATTDKNGVAVVRNLPPREGQSYSVSHLRFAMPLRTIFGNVKRREGKIDLAPDQTVKLTVRMEKKEAPPVPVPPSPR